jgi:hypothetical protein
MWHLIRLFREADQHWSGITENFISKIFSSATNAGAYRPELQALHQKPLPKATKFGEDSQVYRN